MKIKSIFKIIIILILSFVAIIKPLQVDANNVVNSNEADLPNLEIKTKEECDSYDNTVCEFTDMKVPSVTTVQCDAGNYIFCQGETKTSKEVGIFDTLTTHETTVSLNPQSNKVIVRSITTWYGSPDDSITDYSSISFPSSLFTLTENIKGTTIVKYQNNDGVYTKTFVKDLRNNPLEFFTYDNGVIWEIIDVYADLAPDIRMEPALYDNDGERLMVAIVNKVQYILEVELDKWDLTDADQNLFNYNFNIQSDYQHLKFYISVSLDYKIKFGLNTVSGGLEINFTPSIAPDGSRINRIFFKNVIDEHICKFEKVVEYDVWGHTYKCPCGNLNFEYHDYINKDEKYQCSICFFKLSSINFQELSISSVNYVDLFNTTKIFTLKPTESGYYMIYKQYNYGTSPTSDTSTNIYDSNFNKIYNNLKDTTELDVYEVYLNADQTYYISISYEKLNEIKFDLIVNKSITPSNVEFNKVYEDITYSDTHKFYRIAPEILDIYIIETIGNVQIKFYNRYLELIEVWFDNHIEGSWMSLKYDDLEKDEVIYIEIKPYSNDIYSSTESNYQLLVYPYSDAPSEGLSIKDISISNPIYDSTVNGLSNFYSYNCELTDNYIFDTLGSLDTVMTIYDSKGNILICDDNNGIDTNSRINICLTAGETYYIIVSLVDKDEYGDYKLLVSTFNSLDFDFDDAYDFNKRQTVYTHGLYYFSFSNRNSNRYVLETLNITNESEFYIVNDSGIIIEGPFDNKNMYLYSNTTYYFLVHIKNNESGYVPILLSMFESIYTNQFYEGVMEAKYSKYFIYEPSSIVEHSFVINSTSTSLLSIEKSDGSILQPYNDYYYGSLHYVNYELSSETYYIKMNYSDNATAKYSVKIIDLDDTNYMVNWSAIYKQFFDNQYYVPASFSIDSYGINPYDFDPINRTVKFGRIECYFNLSRGQIIDPMNPIYEIGMKVGENHPQSGFTFTCYGEPSFYDYSLFYFYGSEFDIEIQLSEEEWNHCVQEVIYGENYGGDFNLLLDPHSGVTVGTEVLLGGGSYLSNYMTQGYTRVLYLGSNAPSQSRLDYFLTSTDESVVSISSYGTILAKNPGQAFIKAVYKNDPNIISYIPIYVYKDNTGIQRSITLTTDSRPDPTHNGTEVSLLGGLPGEKTIHIGYTRVICFSNGAPSTIIQDYIWQSSDSSIATVDNYGKVRALKSGIVTITCLYKYNNNYIGTIVITVL